MINKQDNENTDVGVEDYEIYKITSHQFDNILNACARQIIVASAK